MCALLKSRELLFFLFILALVYFAGEASKVNFSLVDENLHIGSDAYNERRLSEIADVGKLGIFSSGEICKDANSRDHTFSCKRKLKILVIPLTPVRPESQNTGKRPYHVLECLHGLGHETFTYPLSPATSEPSPLDTSIMSELKNNHIIEGHIIQPHNTSVFLMEKISAIKPDAIILWLRFWDNDHSKYEKIINNVKLLFPRMKLVIFTDDMNFANYMDSTQVILQLKSAIFGSKWERKVITFFD